MKNRLNPNTWRQKRRQLSVKGSPDAGWKSMQAMLDTKMPVTGNVVKPYRLPGSKLWLKWVLGATSAVVIGVGVQRYFGGRDSNTGKPAERMHVSAPAPAGAASQALPIVKADTPRLNEDPATISARVSKPALIVKVDTNRLLWTRSRDTISLVGQQSKQLPHDSVMAVPVISLPNPVRAPVISESHGSRPVQKDSTGNGKNPPKKKKRRISISG